MFHMIYSANCCLCTQNSKHFHAVRSVHLLVLTVCKLTPWSTVTLEMLKALSQSRESLHFMGHKGTLLYLQQPTTCTHNESSISSPGPPLPCSEYPLQHYTPIYTQVFQAVPLLQDFPLEDYAFFFPGMHTTCSAHLILLDLNTQKIFGKKYKL